VVSTRVGLAKMNDVEDNGVVQCGPARGCGVFCEELELELEEHDIDVNMNALKKNKTGMAIFFI